MSYIIVQPRGGFADMISNIQRSLNYAINHNRTLIIDTRGNKAFYFKDIHDYLNFEHPNIYIGDIDAFYKSIKEFTFYPAELKTRLINLYNKYVEKKGFVIDISGAEILTGIDFNKKYDEAVLLDSRCGRYSTNYEIFKYVKFKQIIIDEYNSRLLRLPTVFNSFHIRNTDHKSDVPTFLEKYKSTMESEQFFLASDNLLDIKNIKEQFGENAYSFSNIPYKNGNAIHRIISNDEEEKIQNIIDLISDIITLSSGKEYYYSCRMSGYSFIADYFHKNPDILKASLTI